MRKSELGLKAAELEGDEDGNGGDGSGINKERDDTGTLGEVRFDIDLDGFFDDFVPSKGGD